MKSISQYIKQNIVPNIIVAGSPAPQPVTGMITGAGPFGMAEKPIPTNPDLPPMQVLGHDGAGNKVWMEIQPERDITPFELFQVTTMIMAYSQDEDFCPYHFIKKNHLERHFKFSHDPS